MIPTVLSVKETCTSCSELFNEFVLTLCVCNCGEAAGEAAAETAAGEPGSKSTLLFSSAGLTCL